MAHLVRRRRVGRRAARVWRVRGGDSGNRARCAAAPPRPRARRDHGLASALWATPVFERRLAAIVLLQGQVGTLTVHDLTRIEGFLRSADIPELIEPLTLDVVRPLLDRLTGAEAGRARRIVARWATADADGLRAAAALL